MKYLVLIALLLAVALYDYLDDLSEQAYQARAVRCAEIPDLPGCDVFSTAAGPAERRTDHVQSA